MGDAVAAAIYRATGRVVTVEGHYVGRLERGEHRWPDATRRRAFREVFAVADDADLGFYITKPQPTAADVEPDTPAGRVHALRVDLGRQLAAHREAADLTQDGLGRRAAYSRTTIASIETAARDAPRQFWVAVDEALNAGGVLVKAFTELDDLIDIERRQLARALESERRARAMAAPLPLRPTPTCGCSVVVGVWGCQEVRALREALRLPVRAFAERLGVPASAVTAWENRNRPTRPHLGNEEVLDRLLKLADADTRARYVKIHDHYGNHDDA